MVTVTQTTPARVSREEFLKSLTSRLIIGGSGSGKSEGTLWDLVQIAELRTHAIVLMDPHGELARKFALHLKNRGMHKRLIYDQFSNYDRVLGGLSIFQSNDPNKLRRESENNRRIMAFINILWRAAQRDDGDIINAPMTLMYTELATRIILFQKTRVPLKLYPYLFRLKHPICEYLVQHCTDEEAVEEWNDLMMLARRNSSNLIEQKIGGAKRLARTVFNFPAFRERCDGNFNISTALENKQIIVYDALDDGSVAPEVKTGIFGCVNLQIIEALQAHFARTGNPLPTLVVWEEAPAANQIGPYEINMLREGRKYGFSGWVIGQDLGFLDKDIKATVKSCTPEHVWFNPMDADLAMEAAEDLAFAKLNPHMIKYQHETERMVFDGYDSKTRRGTSKSGERKTESESQYDQARYKQVKDVRPEFYSLDDQIKLEVQKLMTMGQGFRMVRNRTSVSKDPFNPGMLGECWPEEFFPGLTRKKLQQTIAESQARPEFTSPVDSEEQWTPPPTTTNSPASETGKPSTGWTPIPQHTGSSSKPNSTPRRKKRGKG